MHLTINTINNAVDIYFFNSSSTVSKLWFYFLEVAHMQYPQDVRQGWCVLLALSAVDILPKIK